MMAGNPNWWSINTMHPQPQQQGYHESSSTSSSQYLYASSPLPSSTPLADQQEYPRSWSQLLIGGLANDPAEGTLVGSPINYEYKKLDPNWEGQILNQSLRANPNGHEDVKLEDAQSSLFYGGGVEDDEFHQVANRPCWSQVMMPASSPSSSTVTSLCSSLLNFSSSTKLPYQESSLSQCNSTRAGSVAKKPKIQHSTTQPAMKVRKEKLGDRITALHQLVSPFGKTDTASVLSESVGYIRFLQAQIQALSSPYLGSVAASRSMGGGLQQSSVTDFEDRPKDLRSRGLCLVPVSCTLHVGNDNGADYWAPTLGGGF